MLKRKNKMFDKKIGARGSRVTFSLMSSEQSGDQPHRRVRIGGCNVASAQSFGIFMKCCFFLP